MKEREIPNLAKRGVSVDVINPQPIVRKTAEGAKDWPFAQEASYLYDKAVIFRERLIDPIARIDRGKLPDPIIGVDNLRNHKYLAEYILGRDAVGLSFRINLNEEHFIDNEGQKVWRFGKWAELETLLHEYLHGWQETIGFGKQQYKPGRSPHNKEFVQKAESLGLHVFPHFGFHYAVADEPFSILMKEWGIERPEDVPKIDEKKDWFKKGVEPKGRSTLSKWTCGCQNIRIGTKEFYGQCTKPECGHVFVKDDGLTHTVFESPTNHA